MADQYEKYEEAFKTFEANQGVAAPTDHAVEVDYSQSATDVEHASGPNEEPRIVKPAPSLDEAFDEFEQQQGEDLLKQKQMLDEIKADPNFEIFLQWNVLKKWVKFLLSITVVELKLH